MNSDKTGENQTEFEQKGAKSAKGEKHFRYRTKLNAPREILSRETNFKRLQCEGGEALWQSAGTRIDRGGGMGTQWT